MAKPTSKIIIISATLLLSLIVFYHNVITYDDETIISKTKTKITNMIEASKQESAPEPFGTQKAPTSSLDASPAREYDYDNTIVFMQQVFKLLDDHKPVKIAGKNHDSDCTLETLRIDPDYEGPVYSKEYLSKCLTVNFDVFEDLKKKHASFVKNLPTHFPQDMFSGRGIVMVGGVHYSMLGYLVIRILREQGTTLPIEVFMPPGVNDLFYCNEVLPKYNAKCIRLDRIVDKSTIDGLDIKGYQLKSLLFLLSSFNDMLYIDSDNYPIHDIESLFEEEPYTSHGMILWPDFWRRATSPLYYDIAGIELGKQVRFGVDTVTNPLVFALMGLDLDQEVTLHDREGAIPDGTGESSAIFLNKNTHLKTMLLSTYYNIYGPKNYYSLLSQDTFGEGDKETFGALAVLVGEPYWQVKTRLQPGGALLHTGKRPRSTTMLQYSPVQDYKIYQELYLLLHESKQETYDKFRVPKYYNENNKNLTFVHYNLGKLEPLGMIGWNRRYGYDLTDIGFDFELRNVELMVEMFCSEENRGRVEFDYIGSEERHTRLCEESRNLYNRMSLTKDKVITNKLDLDKLEPFSNI